MTLRGAGPRDNRQFVLDLDNLGVEHHASVSSARVSYGGATLAENLPAALAIFADVLQRPHLPAEELDACRQNLLQSLRSVEDEPSEKVMIELRRRHFPDPWGRSSLGEQEALETIGLEEIRGFFQRQFQPHGTILGVAGRVEWEPLKDLVGKLFGDWQPADGAAIDELPAPAVTCTCPTIRPRRTSASPTRACPIATTTIFRPGARSGPWAAA